MIHSPTDQYCCFAAYRRSVCSVANIICEPKVLTWTEISFAEEADIDSLLTEKIIQFNPPATYAVGIPECRPEGFSHVRLLRPCCHIQPQKKTTIFRMACERAGPEGRMGRLCGADESARHKRQWEGFRGGRRSPPGWIGLVQVGAPAPWATHSAVLAFCYSQMLPKLWAQAS